MKSFNKNALTLVELVVSIAITSVLFVIIFAFTALSIEEISLNIMKTNFTTEIMDFQTKISDIKNSGYSNVNVISIGTDSTYTGTTNPSPNNILYLKKEDDSLGLLVGIVDLNTNKLQKNYIYGDNFLGYRELSATEITEINANNSIVFEKIFQGDKIFKSLRAKDFNINLYNSGAISDIDVSIINSYSKDLFGTDFADLLFDNFALNEYNLVF